VLRKGGKVVTIPLAPRTARAIDPGHRGTGRGPDPPWAERRVPTPSPASVNAAALDAGVPFRDVQEAASRADPRTMRYDRASVSLDRHATYIVAALVAGAAR